MIAFDGIFVAGLPVHFKPRLFDVYHQRVHPAWNILHWPTFLRDSSTCYDLPPRDRRSIIALETAICFMAVCTLTEGELLQMGLGQQDDVRTQYRLATQQSLSMAHFMQKPEVQTLQAFMVYLVLLPIFRKSIYSHKLEWSPDMSESCYSMDIVCHRSPNSKRIRTW